MCDFFLEWLNDNPDHNALKDSSYRNVIQRERRSPDANGIKINTELATLGDAVLKLALCDILFEKEEALTEAKKKYETDCVLVEVIAKHYDILCKLKFDKADINIPQNYDYENEDNKKNNKHKYIATAIEACLGAIWTETRYDFQKIRTIVEGWIKLIDKQS